MPLMRSCRPHIERPDQPIGIAPFRLPLDDESLAADHELIAGARVGDLARPDLEGRGLGVDPGLAEAEDRVRAPGDQTHRSGIAADGARRT
jgi:hypothetical protein